MIQLTDNFNSYHYKEAKYIDFNGNSTRINKDKKVIGENLHITLNDYQEKSKNNIFFSFFKDEDKKLSKNSKDDLIISIKKTSVNNEDKYIAQTGNYIGKFRWNGLDVDIGSRFGIEFLERMLNFANDVYLDDVSVSGDKVDKELDISKFIIYYMFIQNLEKAFLLGLPKSYITIKHHDMKLKGKIDINRFIKHDIPFKGKISSSSREQKEIQEIIDVLHKAVSIISKSSFSTKNISHIKTHLKQNRSNKFVSNETISKAIKSKALQNPIFAPYKKVLKYAEYIINDSNLKQNEKGKDQTYGFLINVAELFEIYITKLLQKEFSEWTVNSPKIELYENHFFARKIIPDIVMEKDKQVLVFDTKYKRMKFDGRNQYGAGDLDRNDFFQINTYMSYYKNSNYNVLAGGLLYPMESEYDKNKCFSESWFGNNNTKFIVDGVELLTLNSMDDIVDSEKRFIERINEMLFCWCRNSRHHQFKKKLKVTECDL